MPGASRFRVGGRDAGAKEFCTMDTKRARASSREISDPADYAIRHRFPLSPDNDAIFINGLAFVNTGRSISRFGGDTVCILSSPPSFSRESSVFIERLFMN